jgi:hypothetical protein
LACQDEPFLNTRCKMRDQFWEDKGIRLHDILEEGKKETRFCAMR